MVATWIRTIFTMGTPGAVRAQLNHVADTLQNSHPRVAEMLRDAKADLTAFADFPQAHWRNCGNWAIPCTPRPARQVTGWAPGPTCPRCCSMTMRRSRSRWG